MSLKIAHMRDTPAAAPVHSFCSDKGLLGAKGITYGEGTPGR